MTKKVRVAPNVAIAEITGGRGGKSPALLVSSILNATRHKRDCTDGRVRDLFASVH